MSKSFDMTGWTDMELRELVKELNQHLKIKDSIDLEDELIQNYKLCKASAAVAHRSLAEGTSTAGAAAVLSATTGALKELAKLQTELYNADKAKEFAKIVMAALSRLPRHIAEEYIEEMEDAIHAKN